MSNTQPRVLIVEDDSGVRQALERGLARGGFDTIGAANAADALDFAASSVDQAELAVLDAADARVWANSRTAASPGS